MRKKILVAVDGTAGSGKSATFKKVAQELGYQYIDTGLMYRALTLLGIIRGINFTNTAEIIKLLDDFDYQLRNDRLYLNGEEISVDQLQTTAVLDNINYVTVLKEVRAKMVQWQRQLVTKGNGIIMVGRDITSLVLPDADLKIYLDSSLETRTQRRYLENCQKNSGKGDFQKLKSAIQLRDQTDQNRFYGPLTLVSGVWYLDNSHLTLEETVEMVVAKIKSMEQKNG